MDGMMYRITRRGGTREPSESEAGFGIPEALVSLAILSTVVLGIAASAARSGALLNHAHSRSVAMSTARVQLEALLAQPYDSLRTGSAQQGSTQLVWTVTERARMKEIVLEYRFAVPGDERVDTLTAAARQP